METSSSSQGLNVMFYFQNVAGCGCVLVVVYDLYLLLLVNLILDSKEQFEDWVPCEFLVHLNTEKNM